MFEKFKITLNQIRPHIKNGLINLKFRILKARQCLHLNYETKNQFLGITPMDEDRFQSLTSKIDELITIVNDVNKENQLLKATYGSWQLERQKLLSQNKETKAKLVSILSRLKAIERVP